MKDHDDTVTIERLMFDILCLPTIHSGLSPRETINTINTMLKNLKNEDSDLENGTSLYANFPKELIDSALSLNDARLVLIEAVENYLQDLYEYAVENQKDITPHTQLESTRKFNKEQLKEHLKVELLFDPDKTIIPDVIRKRNDDKKTNNSDLISYLLAERFAKESKFRKGNANNLNLDAVGKEISKYAHDKYNNPESIGDRSVTTRLKNGLAIARELPLK